MNLIRLSNMKRVKGYNIYINQNSGTVQSMGKDDLEWRIKDFINEDDNMYILPPNAMIEAIKRDKTNKRILIGGGDGTIKSAAKILSESGRCFGILPMGTMNLLAKDLGIMSDPIEALKAYQIDVKNIKIDAAYANQNMFLCSAAIGLIPESSEFREEHREKSNWVLMPRLFGFVINHIRKNKQAAYGLTFEKESVHLKALSIIISNNPYTPSKSLNISSFRRLSLNSGKLGVYAFIPQGPKDILRIFKKTLFGAWNKDKNVKEFKAPEVTIQRCSRNAKISLDGESQSTNFPIKFSLKREQISLIIPKEREGSYG